MLTCILSRDGSSQRNLLTHVGSVLFKITARDLFKIRLYHPSWGYSFVNRELNTFLRRRRQPEVSCSHF